MPRRRKELHSTDEEKFDGFTRQVELALEHFAEPEWLGANSVLAAPFVFNQTQKQVNISETVTERGYALQGVLRQAAEQLDAEAQSIIADLFIHRNRSLKNVALAMKRSIGERTFYRRRNSALIAVSAVLYATLLPPLRSEQPAARRIAGRTAVIQACTANLAAGQTVYLSGPSGIGKTVLGAHLLGQWPGPCFWFTVRTGLTDRLSSFVFALAYYLRQQGAKLTWRQLIADKGIVQSDRILGLLRHDLESFRDSPLLICIDDLSSLAPERSDHAQLLHVLDELRSVVRCLLIGQYVVLETDAHHVLKGFDDNELQAWLAAIGLTSIDAQERQALHHATKGHPGLLSLLAALHKSGEDLLATVASMPDVNSLEVLLARVWRRLDEAERQILMEAAVFQTMAPRDFWRSQQVVVDRLIERGLLIPDGSGGIECDGHILSLVYERLSAEHRFALHQRAADALEERGEFIRAMYHYVEGRQPAQAAWLWFLHRTQQIERGQGPAALALLDQIVLADLPEQEDQEVLSVSRAELLALVGRSEDVAQALGELPYRRSDPTAAYAQQLLADAYRSLGENERSLATYRRALETLIESVPLRQVLLHQKMSYLHLTRLPNLAAAKNEAMRALFHAETFAGNVDEMNGDLILARTRYERALEIANQLEDNPALLALGFSHLGKLLLKAGELDVAIEMIKHALNLSEQRGDVIGPLFDRINLSYALLLQERYSEALALAVEGLPLAERMRHVYLIAGLTAAAGDAAYHQRDLKEAEHYALRSLLQEEEYFRSWALTVLGLAQAGDSRPAEAIRTLEMAVNAASNQEDAYGEAYALQALGTVYWQEGQRNKAQTALKRAYQLYKDTGFLFEAERLHAQIAAWGFTDDDESGAGADAPAPPTEAA